MDNSIIAREWEKRASFTFAARGPSPPLFNDLLILIAILIVLVEIYRKLRQIWLRHLLLQKKLDERLLAELQLVHVQLDEWWANGKEDRQDRWLWVAHEATTKLIPVLLVGGRSTV